jgi:hypothetical protein
MKKILLTIISLFTALLVEGQNCPTPPCSVNATIFQDSCPAAQQLYADPPAIYIDVCATNVPSAVVDTMGITATVYTPAYVMNPMTNASTYNVYFSLDTVPGMDSYACGMDIRARLMSPSGTWLELVTPRPFNDGSIPNHYKPTFTYLGLDGIIPLGNGVSYDLCNYMPEGGLLTFAGEDPYFGGGAWELYVYDENGSSGCTDTARITEFCITFQTYVPFSNFDYSWTADSAIWLSYLSDTTIRNPWFTPPAGYYDITYYVTMTESSSGCVATDTINISCPNPSGVEIMNDAKNEFQFFPNPTNGNFKVDGKGELEIYNSIGDLIYSRDLTTGLSPHGEGSAVSLDAPAGIYFVRVSDGDKVRTQKLVIQ